ncbi:HIT family protein [Anaerobacillus sp. CMMVII]|uniref:HIT family protein n=1 Tax=Anaerobacillus sp. CMMVII TaxID=2755588 RepID=UPI0021B7EC14|nr:HIT family protein [Anaerobacillus sp. CMMVII]MCT8138417.1 HIT family protein [Anaerobacillus sp. CMMVII]
MDCLGCMLANKYIPVNVVYENQFVCCILDHEPFNEGHVLIIPKEHFIDVDELNLETSNAVMNAAKTLSKAIKTLYKPDGITICQNGGVFNDLSHFHMHIIPRYKHQSFANFYLEEPLSNEVAKSKLVATRDELVGVINSASSPKERS